MYSLLVICVSDSLSLEYMQSIRYINFSLYIMVHIIIVWTSFLPIVVLSKALEIDLLFFIQTAVPFPQLFRLDSFMYKLVHEL